MADQKTWTSVEILKMWPQAKSELQGFQRQLEEKSSITASQLGLALQLAEAEFERLEFLLLGVLPVIEGQSPSLANTKIEPEKIQDLLRERCGQEDDFRPFKEEKEEDLEIDLSCCRRVDKIREGLQRVSFDFENYECTPGSSMGRFENLLGPRYFGKIPAVGCAAGGDWEYPVFFIIYVDQDGTTLRSYIPKDGNTWNYDLGLAFGNDEMADADFLKKLVTAIRPDLSVEIIEEVVLRGAEIMFDENKIIKDIEDNIQVSS